MNECLIRDFFFLNWLGSSRRASTKGLRMLNDLTGFAAVPGAEQERFQQLLEAASDKFRQRLAAQTPSAASGGSAPAAVNIAFLWIPPERDCGLLDFR